MGIKGLSELLHNNHGSSRVIFGIVLNKIVMILDNFKSRPTSLLALKKWANR